MPHFKLMTNLQNLVAKCIRCAATSEYLAWIGQIWQRWALLWVSGFLLLYSATALAQTTMLQKDSGEVDLSASSTMWIDAQGQTSIAQLVAVPRRERFVPSYAETVYELGHHAALWQHYRFARSVGSIDEWVLDFP
jgi:hypothetical protein